jgi:hypothetical protein
VAEWLYEDGIGENRAALVEGDEIVEAAIELPGGLALGTVLDGRLASVIVPGRRAIVTTAAGEAWLEPIPPGLSEGQKIRVEIVREAIPERGRPKQPRCRVSEAQPGPGPSLAQRLGAFVRIAATGPDRLESAGWSELIEQAASGEIGFPGGALRMDLTAAMTLFDVDGALPPAELAVAGAAAAARAIRRFGIGGSIGIDLPTLGSKAERQAAAEAVDAALPQPFERTAVNGFGFLQIVRRRLRPSLMELVQSDPVRARALALLRRLEREPLPGPDSVSAPAPVARLIASRPDWSADLARRRGRAIRIEATVT